jgi:hypothetical protein
MKFDKADGISFALAIALIYGGVIYKEPKSRHIITQYGTTIINDYWTTNKTYLIITTSNGPTYKTIWGQISVELYTPVTITQKCLY